MIVGLAYGGLYFYYGVTVKQLVEERVTDFGFGALEVKSIDYGPMAPLSTSSLVSADVIYGGAEAILDIRVHGHPLFSDEVRLELSGLQALRLKFGSGN
ncbi:hypothetical protein L861_15200 [Litchfieldella anticariensis FP35 = DSM 16096]|uniref:Uncharacterized protein n=2 Tax=Litchfieldella anticariensis TaxID=258591 RepID=S2LCE1_LITA3|nr:hypothetical protein L861_15200 [Halomonas anticariensis FP35 = DSM 16096]